MLLKQQQQQKCCASVSPETACPFQDMSIRGSAGIVWCKTEQIAAFWIITVASHSTATFIFMLCLLALQGGDFIKFTGLCCLEPRLLHFRKPR